MTRRYAFALVVAATALSSPPVFAQPQAQLPLGTSAADVAQAVIRFVDAVGNADEAALRELIWVGENSSARRSARDLFVRILVAERRLETAGTQRFGADGGAVLASRTRHVLSPADRESLKDAVVYTDEAGPGGMLVQARMVKDDFTTAVRLRRDAEGKWWVVLDLLELRFDDDVPLGGRGGYAGAYGGGPGRGDGRGDARTGPPSTQPVPRGPNQRSQLQLDRMAGIALAIEQMADRVRTGDVGNARAASVELTDRIAAINEEHIKKLSEIRRGPWR